MVCYWEVFLLKIFIDAGHGGSNPGAVGPNGLKESDVNLDVALRLGRLLSSRNYEVKYSRTSNINIGLRERATLANQWGADYFISIHCNSNINPIDKDTSTYYYRPNTVASNLALTVNNSLVSMIQTPDLGTFQANFAVLRYTIMPAILVELAFISNPQEAALLATSSFRENCAIGIFNGIVEFTS